MKTYRFKQINLYGNDWDAEIRVPESAVFYNINGYSDRQQEWYIVIPEKDCPSWGDLEGPGCVQVREYKFQNLVIVYLKNITPYENWPDLGKTAFDKKFESIFKNAFAYRYAQAMYNVNINKDAIDVLDIVHTELIHPETLLACYRFKELSSDAEIQCTRVNLKHRINLIDDPFIDTITLRLCDLPPQELYDTKEKIVFGDETLYKECFENVMQRLY